MFFFISAAGAQTRPPLLDRPSGDTLATRQSHQPREFKPSFKWLDYAIDNIPYLNLEDVTVADQVDRLKRIQQNENLRKLGKELYRLAGETVEIIHQEVKESIQNKEAPDNEKSHPK